MYRTSKNYKMNKSRREILKRDFELNKLPKKLNLKNFYFSLHNLTKRKVTYVCCKKCSTKCKARILLYWKELKKVGYYLEGGLRVSEDIDGLIKYEMRDSHSQECRLKTSYIRANSVYPQNRTLYYPPKFPNDSISSSNNSPIRRTSKPKVNLKQKVDQFYSKLQLHKYLDNSFTNTDLSQKNNISFCLQKFSINIESESRRSGFSLENGLLLSSFKLMSHLRQNEVIFINYVNSETLCGNECHIFSFLAQTNNSQILPLCHLVLSSLHEKLLSSGVNIFNQQFDIILNQINSQKQVDEVKETKLVNWKVVISGDSCEGLNEYLKKAFNVKIIQNDFSFLMQFREIINSVNFKQNDKKFFVIMKLFSLILNIYRPKKEKFFSELQNLINKERNAIYIQILNKFQENKNFILFNENKYSCFPFCSFALNFLNILLDIQIHKKPISLGKLFLILEEVAVQAEKELPEVFSKEVIEQEKKCLKEVTNILDLINEFDLNFDKDKCSSLTEDRDSQTLNHQIKENRSVSVSEIIEKKENKINNDSTINTNETQEIGGGGGGNLQFSSTPNRQYINKNFDEKMILCDDSDIAKSDSQIQINSSNDSDLISHKRMNTALSTENKNDVVNKENADKPNNSVVEVKEWNDLC